MERRVSDQQVTRGKKKRIDNTGEGNTCKRVQEARAERVEN